jgi:SAM-dependent methyltransferase
MHQPLAPQAVSFIARSCPLCGSQPSGNACVFSSPAAETLPFEALTSCWNGFFKKKVFFSYGRCPSCGLLYTPQFFDKDRLSKLYAEMPPNMDVVPVDMLRRTQKEYFEILKRYSPLKDGYLEVGPDIGLFTENCVTHASFDRYWLFEPNRTVWPTLHAVMKDIPHEIVPDMFGFDRVPDHSIGTAVMVHVLDHVLDPAATLKDIHKKLLPGGVIAIVTHDERSMLSRILGSKWPAFCLQHPQLYNPTSIRALLDEVGLETIEIKKTANYFPLHFLIKQALWAMGLPIRSLPSLGDIALGLKLGNILTIARA